MTEPHPKKETQPCDLGCGGTMEKCGDGWYCRNPECGYNYSLVRRASHSDSDVLDKLWWMVEENNSMFIESSTIQRWISELRQQKERE